MPTIDIIQFVILGLLIIYVIYRAVKSSKVVTQHRRAILTQHPQPPVTGDWPPDELKFP
jgi:hypothetical protein